MTSFILGFQERLDELRFIGEVGDSLEKTTKVLWKEMVVL
jgi:hypothetical protein